MESMLIGYPPEDSGKLSITASEGEWVVIRDYLQMRLGTLPGPVFNLLDEIESWT